MAWLVAKQAGGTIVLRIEDLDPDRSKAKYTDGIMRDLESLGLLWDVKSEHQSKRSEAYEQALDTLKSVSNVYPCFCSRADLHSAGAPHAGERLIYSGKCRDLSADEASRLKSEGRSASLRLEMPDSILGFNDAFQGRLDMNLAKECGDIIIRRTDGVFAYQLAVVVDDAANGITSVVRGVDLLDSTPQQIHLFNLLQKDVPEYAHVPLFVDKTGRRLSKRNSDAGIDALTSRFSSPSGIIGHIAYLAGLTEADEPTTPSELLAHIGTSDIGGLLKNKRHIIWS